MPSIMRVFSTFAPTVLSLMICINERHESKLAQINTRTIDIATNKTNRDATKMMVVPDYVIEHGKSVV
jgi:hypothetical protein